MLQRMLGIVLVLISLNATAFCEPLSKDSLRGKTDEQSVIARSLKGQELIFERRYDDAEKIFRDLLRDVPDSPAGFFGLMAMYEVQMLERENFFREKEFREVADQGLEVVGKVLQKYRPSTWDLFLCGAVIGFDGFFRARKGEWWTSYTEGTRSRQIFRRIKEMDPHFVDADFGIGMYLYWRSVFSRDLWFLRFIPDKREEGIRIVEEVARKGKFSKHLAQVNLVIMYFEEKRFADARRILDPYIARYPQNVVLRRLLGKVLIAQKQYDVAVSQFQTMLTIEPALQKPRYFIGAALVLKGDPKRYAEAQRELELFLTLDKGRYWPAYAHYWLGRLADRQGRKQEANRQYQAAMTLEPKIEEAVKRVRGLGGGV